MARMIQLTPAPHQEIGAGPYRLVATEAGRYAQGLQFTCQAWNGQSLRSDLVQANAIAPYVGELSEQYSLVLQEVERAVLDLVYAVEGLLRARRSTGTGAGTDPRPEIELTPEITQVADQTETALLKAGQDLYQHARRLVSIAADTPTPPGLTRPDGLPLISPMTVSRLAEEASRAARFFTYVGEGDKAYCRPPVWLMQTLLERTTRAFPALEAIVHTPTLRPDGSLLESEGYDRSTGLYADYGGTTYPPTLQTPTRDDARQALQVLTEPLCDFPFIQPHHRSALLGMMLTVVCRHFIQGCVPLGAITAPGAGSGKSLLAQVIALVTTGRPCTFWAQPLNDEEERKRLLAIGLEGHAVVCIDNIMRPLGSGAFANVLTSLEYADRVLGVSQTAHVRFHCLWLATGNNVTYLGEVARRVVPIVIDPKMEHPEERTAFKYPKILAHVLYERPSLVAAALTIMLAYVSAGCPRQGTKTYGSFEDWYEKICGALMWLGEADPCDGREALQDDVDDELLSFRQLVLCWHTCYSWALGTPRTLKQVAFDIDQRATHDPTPPNEWNELRDALGAFQKGYDGQHLDLKQAGYVLRKYARKVVAGMRFVAAPHTRHGAPWVLDVV